MKLFAKFISGVSGTVCILVSLFNGVTTPPQAENAKTSFYIADYLFGMKFIKNETKLSIWSIIGKYIRGHGKIYSSTSNQQLPQVYAVCDPIQPA